MQVTVIATGTAVIFFTAVDFVWMTLAMRGAGPLPGRLSTVGGAFCSVCRCGATVRDG